MTQAVRADKSVCESFLLRLSTLKWGYFMLLSHRESELCKQLPPSTSARSSETDSLLAGDNSRRRFSPQAVLRLRAEDAARRLPAGRAGQRGRGFPDGAPVLDGSGVGGGSLPRLFFPYKLVVSLLKCTHLRRRKDCRWVFWLSPRLYVFLFSAAASLERALWLQQFGPSSPLAWVWTSLFFLCFSYKVVNTGKCPSGIPEPSLYIHFNKVRLRLFIFIGLSCMLLKPIDCAS